MSWFEHYYPNCLYTVIMLYSWVIVLMFLEYFGFSYTSSLVPMSLQEFLFFLGPIEARHVQPAPVHFLNRTCNISVA